MGNSTNDRNWAAMERLRFIETCAWWKGVVQRQDLLGVFGVSMAQASSDHLRDRLGIAMANGKTAVKLLE